MGSVGPSSTAPGPEPTGPAHGAGRIKHAERLVLFDLDNTLVDRQAAFRRWARRWGDAHGLGPEAVSLLEELDADGMTPRDELFRAVSERWGIGESVDDQVKAYHRDYPTEFQPEPLVQQGLGQLRAEGWRMGIVSNGPAAQHQKVERAGLEQLVDAVVISAEEGVTKPDPVIFRRAVERCGVRLETLSQGWMVGDAPVADVLGGRAAGLRTVWVDRGRPWGGEVTSPSVDAHLREDLRPDLVVANVVEAMHQLLQVG